MLYKIKLRGKGNLKLIYYTDIKAGYYSIKLSFILMNN